MQGHLSFSGSLPCWCGANDWPLVCKSKPKRFAVLRCAVCNTYRIDPPRLTNETDAQSFYTEYYLETRSGSWNANSRSSRDGPFWSIARQLPELLIPNGAIAEIGCGDGDRCAQLKDAGWPRVIGFELSKSRAARTRLRHPDIEIYDSTIEESELEPASLQVVVMEAVIEHLPNPLKQMREIANFLKPGGLFVLTTPNMDSGNFKLLRSLWTPSLAPHVHLFLFGANSIKALLAEVGLEPVLVGSLQTETYKLTDYARRVLSGDIKGVFWRAIQETGNLFGRLLGEGPLLFAVGRKA